MQSARTQTISGINYLINSNPSPEKIVLLGNCVIAMEGPRQFRNALKLLRLLHVPNHPLIDQRKRLLVTVTGYKKNWWKKCRKDNVHDTEQRDN
jgi:hypothetical protein